jgi:uncharacterized protein
MNVKRAAYLSLGFISLAIGALGVFLPVLPTTPFVIVAAFCFSRGSEAWHQWLLQNRMFGPGLRDWENYGVIRIRPKCMASVLIVISFTTIWFVVKAPLWAKIAMVSTGALVLLFIWSRPSEPKKNGMPSKTD